MKTPKPFFQKILNSTEFVKRYWIAISISSLALIAASSIIHQKHSIEKQIESNREYRAKYTSIKSTDQIIVDVLSSRNSAIRKSFELASIDGYKPNLDNLKAGVERCKISDCSLGKSEIFNKSAIIKILGFSELKSET